MAVVRQVLGPYINLCNPIGVSIFLHTFYTRNNNPDGVNSFSSHPFLPCFGVLCSNPNWSTHIFKNIWLNVLTVPSSFDFKFKDQLIMYCNCTSWFVPTSTSHMYCTVLLYCTTVYCITVPLYYCITVLLYHCITVLLYYCITVRRWPPRAWIVCMIVCIECTYVLNVCMYVCMYICM